MTNTLRATTLERGNAKVFTVEHILSALFALRIDNCILEMDAPEPPVADGGALTFSQMILEAGIVELEKPIDILTLETSVAVYEDNKFITALPYDGLRITFTSINPHPLLGTQMKDFTIDKETYIREIAPPVPSDLPGSWRPCGKWGSAKAVRWKTLSFILKRTACQN